MKYKLQDSGVYDTETGQSIPNSTDNRHWRQYLEWVALGNTADPEFTQTEIETARVTTIKAAASNRIVNLLPAWKQRNQIARMLEILASTIDLSVLPTKEQLEIHDAATGWAAIKAIRNTSNAAESNGTAPEDVVW